MHLPRPLPPRLTRQPSLPRTPPPPPTMARDLALLLHQPRAHTPLQPPPPPLKSRQKQSPPPQLLAPTPDSLMLPYRMNSILIEVTPCVFRHLVLSYASQDYMIFDILSS